MTNRFYDKPYINVNQIDTFKINELFNISNNMDTQDLLQYSLINKIPLGIISSNNGNNIIHNIILNTDIKKNEFNKLNIIKFLIQNNVNLDQPNINNQTPLHLACENQYLLIITYLIENGADINYKDNNGLTPLHYLLSGQIKLENNTDVIDFIFPEKTDESLTKKNNFIEIKHQLWNQLKLDNNFQNYLELLENSIYDSLNNNDEVEIIIEEMKQKIGNILLDKSNFGIKNLQDYINLIRFKFKNIIKKMWNSFPELNEINIHTIDTKENSSYVSSPDSKYSMFKNYDIRKQLKKNIKNNIDLSVETINKSFEKTIDNNNLLENLGDILDKFRKENPTKFTINNNDIEFDDIITNNFDSWSSINNNDKHHNAKDHADNIIDLENKSFIGGSRNITIIDTNILANIRHIIDNYTNTDIYKLIKYILLINIITDEYYAGVRDILDEINNDNTNTIDIATYSQNYNNFQLQIITFASESLDLLINNYSSNIGLTIYYNYCKLKCNNNNNNNLNGEVELLFFRLISAIINCNKFEDLYTSIMNSFKIDVFNSLNIQDKEINLRIWIGILLCDDIDIFYNIPQLNDFKDLQTYTTNLVCSEELKNIILYDYTNKEIIIEIILNYYNNLLIKPSLYIIIDTIYYLYNQDHYNEFSLIYNINTLHIYINYYFLYCKKYNNYTNNDIVNFKLNLLFTKCIPASLTNLIYINNSVLESINNNNVYNQDDILIINKFIESRNLGLYYYGCLPNCYENIDNLNNIFTILNNNNTHTLNNSELVQNQLPLPGNFILNNNNNQFNTNNYFGLGNINNNNNQIHYQYRPAFYNNYEHLIIENIKILNDLNAIILSTTKNKCLKDLLKNLLANKQLLNKLSEIYSEFHFNIIKVIHHQELLLSFINKKIILFPIDKLLSNINNINGYYFTYYYLYYPDKVYKIPKFIYYKLESNYKNKKFKLFNDTNTNLLTLEDEIKKRISINTNTNTDTNTNVNINTNIHNNLINLLLLNIENINIVNTSFIKLKKYKLPPSVYVILPDFFKFNKINIIIEMLKKNIKINTDIKQTNLVINVTDTKIYSDYIIAQLIEEIINDKANYLTDITSIKYFEKINQKIKIPIESTIIFKPTEFNINISKFNLNDLDFDDFPRLNEFIIINFYKLSNSQEKKNNIFYIYPIEYTNTNLLKQRYILNINKDIVIKLLNNDTIKPYIVDNNYNSCIISLLKYHHSYILNELKNNDFNFTNLPDKPVEFIKYEYKNHIYKIADSTNKYINYINNFIEPQYKEIELLILANEKFGNNILSNLKLSFQIAYYIMNEYLTDYLWRFNDNYKLNNLDDILNLISINNKNYIQSNYLNSIIDTIGDIPILSSYILILELIKDLHQEKDLLINRKNRLLIDSEQYKDIHNLKTQTDNKITEIIQEINKINDNIEKLNNVNISYLKSNNSLQKNKIINTYKTIRNTNYHTYLKLWDSLLNNEELLKNSWNISQLLILNIEKEIIDKKQEIIDKISEKNKEQELIKKLKIININHKHLSELAETYFNNEKYNNSSVNKVACFIYDTLLHLTESTLCFNIEMILRKVIFNHIKSINPNDIYSDINDKIEYLFNYDFIFENNYSNLKTILYNIIAPKLLDNSINLFHNMNDKINFEPESIKDILNNYFNLLLINNSIPFNDKDYAIKILKREVSSYFDTIISKTINNWYVVMENTLKFSINQYRINDCLLSII